MVSRRAKELMMVSLPKAVDLYLSTLETEGKSPRYIDWLSTRLRFFNNYMEEIYGKNFMISDLAVEDGRAYIKHLMERKKKYKDHPMHNETKGKLKIQYIHGLGRAVRSFSTWAHEEGFLEENVMRRLKLPKSIFKEVTHPNTFPLFPSLAERSPVGWAARRRCWIAHWLRGPQLK